MANKQLSIGLWLLSALFVATAHTETTPPTATASDTQSTVAGNELASSTTQTLLQEQVPTDEYAPPKYKKTPQSSIYPSEELRAGHEGWATLNMMIDTQGKPYELSVVDSTGNSSFEKAALQWASHYKFEPATFNGAPVDAGMTLKVKFVNGNIGAGASDEFIRGYKSLEQAVKGGDQGGADAALQSLKVQNLYEDAYYGLAQFMYFRHWGSKEQQLQALDRAIAYEHGANFLPDSLFQFATAAIFDLQIRTQDFGGALLTYKDLSKEKQNTPEIQQKIADIKALRNDGSAYAVRGEIPKTTSWFYELFKRHFSILVTDGTLAEVKLRCERKYVLIPYKGDLDYTVPDAYGNCRMELIGSSGTEFTLIQS